jgi:hypothetical protein
MPLTAIVLNKISGRPSDAKVGKTGKIFAIGWVGHGGVTLQIFCSRRPMDMDKPNFLSQVAEIVFLRFIEQVPSKIKNQISAVYFERKTFRLRSL